jgi:alkanesulfonate monooxygenase
MDMLAEQIEIVHRLWGRDGEDVTFEGEHYRLEACPPLPRPYQEPHPPLIMGSGAGPRSVALAARWADEYNLVYVDPAVAKERGRRVSAACEAIGRDPADMRRSVMIKVVVGADEAELRRRAVEHMAWQNEEGDVEAYLDVMRTTHLVGTPEQALERLAEFAAAGMQRVLLQQLPHGDLESVELIGREVLPEAARL